MMTAAAAELCGHRWEVFAPPAAVPMPMRSHHHQGDPMSAPDQPATLPPDISIRAVYRQLGTGPEEIEVSWDAGTHTPSAALICAVIDKLSTIPTEATR